MIRKLVTLSLPVAALVGGAIAGDLLRPATADPEVPGPAADHAAADEAASTPPGDGHDADAPAPETGWFTFPSQFFVPLVRQGDLRDMMILTLTLQGDATSTEALARHEHALRDALLRALMIHANTGGFDGNYTAERNLALLRESLLTAAQGVSPLPLEAVLIEDIALQPG